MAVRTPKRMLPGGWCCGQPSIEERHAMSAFAVVRFRARPGLADDFQRTYCSMRRDLPGLIRVVLIKTGEREFCAIGEWEHLDRLVASRSSMRSNLDQMRHLLEPFNDDLGVTDPVSGEAVLDMRPGC
jgi:hypothetical protein